jgi:hypothetical protein
MSGTTIGLGGAERVAHPESGKGRSRRLRLRHLWLVPGLAIAILANQLGQANGVGILGLIAFGIAPDMPRLLGSRGRRAHNLTHGPLAPIAAVAIGATGIVPVAWLVGSLVWLGHVVVGLGVGDVPRGDGTRTHA